MTEATADTIARPCGPPPWLIAAGAVFAVLTLAGLLWVGMVWMGFASETSRGTWSAEERAAFEARSDIYFAYDAEGREIMVSYLDGEPYSISVHTGPNSSEQRLVEHGAEFIAYTETGEIWVRPDTSSADGAPRPSSPDIPPGRAE